MEYKRIEQENEVVLSYCPADHEKSVVLRYERELPERMLAQEKAAPEKGREDGNAPREETTPSEVVRLQTPRKKKRGWLPALVTTLCLAVAVGCVGAGLWWLAGDWDELLGIPVDATKRPDTGGSTVQPDVPEGAYRDETERSEGETTIERYHPSEDLADAFCLVSVPVETTPLTAGEIYQKIFPSTVTILGLCGDSYSVGTGIVFTSDGYIMTNYHVIAGCSGCEVWITDQYGVDASYDARLVGGDEEQDIAVLKVEAEGLTPAEFGVSGDLTVGDKVYAIGNPLGLELRSTFTDGIVSYVNRSVDVDGVTMTLIQTNAALNSGNSGGPLVNQYGQVVGINTIKMMSGYDTIEGLGFAIPTSIAERWIQDILTSGEIRPQVVLGLKINRIPTKLPDETIGLEVVEVTKWLSAYRAGIQVGDYIVGFNGVAVSTVDDIYRERQTLSVGDQVSVRIYRDEAYLDLTMVMRAETE